VDFSASQWLEVVGLKQPVDSALAHLDAAERETISLASELQANPSVDGRTRRCDYSSASLIESGRHARIVGHCCSPRTRRVANHVRTVARDHVPVTGSAHGEHARAGCRTRETPGRPTVAVTAEVASSSLVVPAISFQELAESAPFSRGHKKAQNRYRKLRCTPSVRQICWAHLQ
jgi:hypothetical protein